MGKRLYPIIFILLAGCTAPKSLNVCPDGYFLSGSKCIRQPFKADKCPGGYVKVEATGKCYVPGIYYTEEETLNGN